VDKFTGADIVLKVLEKHGVDCIFGYPGGTMLPLYDALYQHPKIKHYLVRHEQGAVHMAEGYARTTGKVGVVFVTSGPGATNTVTGLANAKLDSVPVLVITAQVVQSLIGTDGFQEADVVGITIAATKHNDLIREKDELEKAVTDAMYYALEGRPGPILLDIPKDVLMTDVEYKDLSVRKVEKQVDGGDFADAARALCEAKRPVCYFGGGIINADASKELKAIVDKLNIPATGTLMGLGAISGIDPHNIGMPGMHGTYTANTAIHQSDCILAAGVRFDDRVTGKLEEFAPHAKIVHVDVDDSEIHKIRNVEWPLVGDAKPVLKKLKKEIDSYLAEGHVDREKLMSNWWADVNGWLKKNPLKYNPNKKIIKPQSVIEEVYTQSKGDLIVTTDVGQHQMWSAQFFPVHEPREWLSSGGLGTMGFGLPAGIGAQIGRPDKQAVVFVGDGSFQMTMQEMALLMGNEVPLKVVILNNSSLGMVRQWQDLFHDKRFSETDISISPDFMKIADAYGVKSRRVEKSMDLADGVKEMLKEKEAFLLEVIVDKDEHVYPMVPSGGAAHQMILHPDD